MFATLDKPKPETENIRGLNLAAVMCMTVSNLSRLQRETSKRHVGETHCVPTAILLPQRELLLRQNSVTVHAHQS
jgi:hypothetical protein